MGSRDTYSVYSYIDTLSLPVAVTQQAESRHRQSCAISSAFFLVISRPGKDVSGCGDGLLAAAGGGWCCIRRRAAAAATAATTVLAGGGWARGCGSGHPGQVPASQVTPLGRLPVSPSPRPPSLPSSDGRLGPDVLAPARWHQHAAQLGSAVGMHRRLSRSHSL